MKKRSDDTEILIHHENRFEDQNGEADYEDLSIAKTARRAFSPWPHVFNLANCIVGVSVLAMPFVFQQCGILLAVIMIGVCAVLTKHTCHFLSKASFISSKHSYEALGLEGTRLIWSPFC
ncbi:hypothetical protein KIN20_023843 [Parelaphostrongylus tenuis]|uniref:Amino acid transporter transmembrane domain-containing protein n=1 Tax=Parelaphostrongylus tenuis TaxID=148309 RepID=A0AAD5NCG2_PARTN|nr:hypothetical protein KIN20_023843 [Parelaphostrongylus tenuis]